MVITDRRMQPLDVAWDYVEALGVIALVTVGGLFFSPLNYHALGYIYLLTVIALSLRIKRWPVLIGAILSGLAWNFFFVPPRLSFSILHPEDILLLGSYFIVALIGSQVEALRSAADRAKLLAESERMHQTLLDGVAHELKTPIAVFRSAMDQLVTNDPARREYLLAEVRLATERLDGLVTNLLNQSRLESGMLRPQLDWCDGRELVLAACRMLGGRLKGRPVEVKLPSDLPLFRADAALMEEVIAQLLLNAAVHTPAPGRIQIEGGVDDDSKQVFIAVADEGPGIPDGLRRRLFDKFNHEFTGRKRGLGLGLSVVRGFMLAQGGDVTVESPPEGGAKFVLSLPLMKFQPVPNG